MTNLTHHTEILAALADANRLRLLKCLQVRPLCVCELMQATGLPQSRISRHLRVLRDAGLVADRRDAQWVEYSLADNATDAPAAHVLALISTWLEDDAQILADRAALADASRRSPVPCCDETEVVS